MRIPRLSRRGLRQYRRWRCLCRRTYRPDWSTGCPAGPLHNWQTRSALRRAGISAVGPHEDSDQFSRRLDDAINRSRIDRLSSSSPPPQDVRRLDESLSGSGEMTAATSDVVWRMREPACLLGWNNTAGCCRQSRDPHRTINAAWCRRRTGWPRQARPHECAEARGASAHLSLMIVRCLACGYGSIWCRPQRSG